MRIKRIVYSTALIVTVLVQHACAGTQAAPPIEAELASAGGTAEATASPVPPTSTPAPSPTGTTTATSTPMPAPTLGIDVPEPAEGKGNIAGLVLWNGAPVARAAVKLCQEFSYAGCEGLQYSANSDKQGYFLFENVVPDGYVVIINIFTTSWWSYLDDVSGPHKDHVAAGQTLILEARQIYKVDLRAVSPANSVTVKESRPTLKWDAYPGAASYRLMFKSYYFGLLEEKTLETNEYLLDRSLLNCEYEWSVEALNASGNKIAEMRDEQSFKTADPEAGSCHMEVISPKDGAKLGGQGIELSWEPYPGAACYLVTIKKDLFTEVLKDIRVEKNRTSYVVPQVLEPGAYGWHVVACDESGTGIASSDTHDFTVTAP